MKKAGLKYGLKLIALTILTGILWMPVSVFAEEESEAIVKIEDVVQTTAAAESPAGTETETAGTGETQTPAAAGTFQQQAQTFARQNRTILPGVYIDGQDVGNLTREDAYAAMIAYADRCGSAQVTFQVENHQVVATMRDFRIGFGNDLALDDALGYGRSGSLIAQYKTTKELESNPCRLAAHLTYDQDYFRSFVTDACEALESPAVNAKAVMDKSGKLTITPSKNGAKAGVDDALTSAYQTLDSWDGNSFSVPVSVVPDIAKVTEADLQGIGTQLLGVCETKYKTEDGFERCENLRVACEKINGQAFLNGMKISANEMMSPITEAGGYYNAHAFQDGQTILNIGGGICQISTTLYDAALWAELEVIYRKNHSMMVSYVDAAMDAMVYPQSGADLELRNNTGNAIFFQTEFTDDTVVIRIYGTEYRPENRKIDYVSKEISSEFPEPQYQLIHDDTIPVGSVQQDEWLRPKVTAELWKKITVDGQTQEVLINTSTYGWSTAKYRVHSGCGIDGQPVQ